MDDILRKCVKCGDSEKVKAYFKVIDKLDMKENYKNELGKKQRELLKKLLVEQRREISL